MRLSRSGSIIGLAALAFGATGLAACTVSASLTFDGHGPGGGDGVIEERFDFVDTLTPTGTTGYTCDQVGITQIGFTLTNHSTQVAFSEILVPCVDGRALVIDQIPVGPYDIITRFYDMNHQIVVQDNDVFDPTDPQAPVIKCDGDTADCKLSTILHVNATGNFDFVVDYGNAGGANCQGGSTGGNGVGQQALIVDNSRNISISFNLQQPGMAAPGQTLQPGDVIACVENNVTQTIFNQYIGYYQIQIKGLKVTTTPAFVCYKMAAPAMFQVTATPATSPTTFLVPFSPDPGQDTACNAT